MLILSRLSIIIICLIIFGFALLQSIETYGEPTLCTFCCEPGCHGARVLGYTPPTPTPEPTPTPTPSPSPEAFATVEIACTTYNLPPRSSADAGDFEDADVIRDSCKLVLDWYYPLIAQSWCPYIMDGSLTEYCGPYDNYGFMYSTRDGTLGGYLYDDGGAFQPCSNETDVCGYMLKDNDALIPVAHGFGFDHEKLTDRGNPDFNNFFMDYFEDMPDTPASLAAYEGTNVDKDWNLRFLDNFHSWILEAGGWSDTPMNPRTNADYTRSQMDADVLDAAEILRARADLVNVFLFANIWSDVESEYFDRPIYALLMDEIDFALFEEWAYDWQGPAESETIWLRRVNAAQDMIKNRRAVPIVDGEFGASYWYSLASLLLVKENGKGMIWFWYGSSSFPSSGDLTKMLSLDCGQPSGVDYQLVSSSYYRKDWDNCIILVNPKTGSTGSISLGGNYTNLETGATVSSITLSAKTGAILVAQ